MGTNTYRDFDMHIQKQNNGTWIEYFSEYLPQAALPHKKPNNYQSRCLHTDKFAHSFKDSNSYRDLSLNLKYVGSPPLYHLYFYTANNTNSNQGCTIGKELDASYMLNVPKLPESFEIMWPNPLELTAATKPCQNINKFD